MIKVSHDSQNKSDVLRFVNSRLKNSEFCLNTIKTDFAKKIFEIKSIKKRIFKKSIPLIKFLKYKKFEYIIESTFRIKNIESFELIKQNNLKDKKEIITFIENDNTFYINLSSNLSIIIKISGFEVKYGRHEFINIQKNSSRLIDPLRIIPSRGHYNLTRPALKKEGFSKNDIKTAFKANMSVDDLVNRTNKAAHFMPGTQKEAEKIISQKLNDAINYELDGNHELSIKSLGEGLHTLQDRFSHFEQNAGCKEHMPWGNDPDNPQKHIAEFIEAYKASVMYARQYKQELESRKEYTKKLYDEINFILAMKDAFLIQEEI